jgi:hypothetical protein
VAFSLWEKVAKGRMRGLQPEGEALTRHTSPQTPHPALKRATFSQREKEELRTPWHAV